MVVQRSALSRPQSRTWTLIYSRSCNEFDTCSDVAEWGSVHSDGGAENQDDSSLSF